MCVYTNILYTHKHESHTSRLYPVLPGCFEALCKSDEMCIWHIGSFLTTWRSVHTCTTKPARETAEHIPVRTHFDFMCY